MSNFISECLNGNALLDDIDEYVDAWHEGSNDSPLHQYLGMSNSEYKLWVVDPDVLPFILTARRQQKDVGELLTELDTLPMAARADAPEKARQLMSWLKKSGLWS